MSPWCFVRCVLCCRFDDARLEVQVQQLGDEYKVCCRGGVVEGSGELWES